MAAEQIARWDRTLKDAIETNDRTVEVVHFRVRVLRKCTVLRSGKHGAYLCITHVPFTGFRSVLGQRRRL